MWFSSKQIKERHQKKGGIPFLRKALPERREYRTLKKEQKGSNHVAVIFLWILFFGTIFYLFFFSSFVLIEKVQVSGMSEISEESLRGFVEGQLAGKYWGIFPKRAYAVVQPQTLERRLREQYPLLATASIGRIFPNGLHLAVTERKKIILWNSLGLSYLVDEDGITHESTRALSPENETYVITVTDTSDKAVTMGERVFTANYGAFIIDMNEQFPEQLGLALEPRYTIVSRFAEELRARTDEGWEVYFDTSIPIETSLNTLKLLFEKELPPEKRSRLAYIDLRAENRAYYTFRDGTNIEAVPPVIAPDTQAQGDKKDVSKKKK